MRRLLLFCALSVTFPAFAGPIDTLGAAAPYVAQAIDLLALPSAECDRTCQLRSLIEDASITYGKLKDEEYAVVFFTVHTRKDDREMVLLMRVITDSAYKQTPSTAFADKYARPDSDAVSVSKRFSVVAVGPQIDGGKPTSVFFSDDGIVYSSSYSPHHQLQLNDKGVLTSKVLAPLYTGSKKFIVERESVYPENTENAVTLGMPFSIDAVKSVLPDRLELDLENLEGVNTISTVLGHAKDAGSIEIYARDGKVDGLEVGKNAENSLGVKIGAPALSIPSIRPKDCEMDDLSGDYICTVKPEPYFYRLGMKDCHPPIGDSQLPQSPASIACMKVTGIAIGNTRM